LAYPAQSIRSARARVLPHLTGGFRAVVLAFAADYLGIQTRDRNAAAATGSEPRS
jgi:hypothetical protein